MGSGKQTEYRIFVGLGIALILLGLYQIFLYQSSPVGPAVFGVDLGGFGLILSGAVSIVATHHYHRIES